MCFPDPLCDSSSCELVVFGVVAELAGEKRKETRCSIQMDLLGLTSTESDGFPRANLFIVHYVPGFALARLRFFGLLTHLSSGTCLANTCRLNRVTKLPQGRRRGREVGRHPPGGGSKMTGPWGVGGSSPPHWGKSKTTGRQEVQWEAAAPRRMG